MRMQCSGLGDAATRLARAGVLTLVASIAVSLTVLPAAAKAAIIAAPTVIASTGPTASNIFLACGYDHVVVGGGSDGCLSLPDALTAAVNDMNTKGENVTIAMSPGLYCPIAIPNANQDLTFVGIGSAYAGSPASATGFEAELTSFRWDSTHCGTTVPTAFITVHSYGSYPYVHFRNLTVDGSVSGGPTTGFNIASANADLRDVIVEHNSATGVKYNNGNNQYAHFSVDQSALLANGVGLDYVGAYGGIGESTVAGNTTGIRPWGNFGIGNVTISHNGTGVNAACCGNDLQVAHSVVADNTSTDCTGGDWESTGFGENLLGAHCLMNQYSATGDVRWTGTSIGALTTSGITPSIDPPGQAIGLASGACGQSDQRERLIAPGTACDAGSVQHNGNGTAIASTYPNGPIDFGQIHSGDSSTKTVTITNTGGGLLSIQSVALSGSAFTLTSDTCSYAVLVSGQGTNSCTLTVTAKPTSVGTAAGTVTIAGQGATITTIALTAQGVLPWPTTLTVTRTDDPAGVGGCQAATVDCSLRQAVTAIGAAGTITLPAGTYSLTQPDAELRLDRAMTINGAGARTTTIKQTVAGHRVMEVTGAATIRALTITGGQSTAGVESNNGDGGAVLASGGLDLESVSINGNRSDGDGGAIAATGDLTINQSILSANIANGRGGGINATGSTAITNSTIAGNSADTGGGIWATILRLVNDTIAANVALEGGGLYAAQTSSGGEGPGVTNVEAVNVVLSANLGGGVAKNCAGDSSSGPYVTSGDHNLDSDGTCGLTGATDLTGNPQLGTLADNGGPTDTILPAAGSPLIDAGADAVAGDPSTCPATDQRGVVRPQGTHCDIGAVEASASVPPPVQPDVSIAMTHTDPFAGGGTGTYTITGQNKGAGAAPLADLVFVPPPGVSFVSLVTPSLPDAFAGCKPIVVTQLQFPAGSIDCQPHVLTTLAPGETLPPITVNVTIAADAAGGTAQAHLAVMAPATDAHPDDNLAQDPTTIVIPTTSPPGLYVSMAGQGNSLAGQQVPLTVRVSNTATTPLSGPMVVDLILPSGHPAGQSLPVQSVSGDGWNCESFPLSGRTVLECREEKGVLASSGLAPLTVTVAVPADASRGTDLISYSARSAVGNSATGRPFVLRIGAAQPAHLVTTLTGPGQLSALAQKFTVDVQNTGSGSTSGPTVVTLPLPADVTIALPTGSAWTCTTAATVTCTLNQDLLPGAQAPPIDVMLTGQPTATLDATSVSLLPKASSVDALGAMSGTGVLTVARSLATRPALELKTAAVGPGYVMTVHNTGDGPSSGPLTVSEQLPAGFTASAHTGGTPWTCAQSGTTFTCTAAGVVVAAGSTAGPPPVTVTPPPGVSGSFTLAGGVRAGSSVGTMTSIPVEMTRPDPNAPVISTTLTLADNPLYSGEITNATVELRSDPVKESGPAAIAVLLPSGATARNPLTVSGVSVTPQPGTAAIPTFGTFDGMLCAIVPKGTALVCASKPLVARSSITARMQVAIGDKLGSTLEFASGIVPGASGLTQAALLASAETIIAAQGVSALAYRTVTTIPTARFAADAGTPQHLVESTPGTSGTPTQMRVNLDASNTSFIGRKLSYAWVQTMGPKVSWLAPRDLQLLPGQGATPAFPAGTSFAGTDHPRGAEPSAYGVQRSFTAPNVSATTTLGFRVYVTDGFTVSSADTAVTLDPLPDTPPTATSLVATDLTTNTTLVPAGSAPAAGDLVQVVVTTADADGDPVQVAMSLLRPFELGLTFTAAVDPPSSHTRTFTFTWPTNRPQLTLQAILTDGHLASNGTAVSSQASLVLGPDALPLGVSVPAPTDPAAPGTSVALHATLDNATADGATSTVSWKYVSGTQITLDHASGPDTSFTVPASAVAGDSVVLEADAVRGTGTLASTASATVTVTLTAATPLSVGVNGLGSLQVAPSAALDLAATGAGGSGALTYAWSVLSGGGTLANAATAKPAYTAGADAGFATLQVTVTDAAHHSVSQPVPVLVGTAPVVTPDPAADPCSTSAALGALYQQFAAHGAGTDFVLSVGSLKIDLGHLTLPGVPGAPCTPDITITLTDATATFGVLTFSHVSGTLNRSGLIISSATVTVPSEWRLPTATITDLKVVFAPLSITGSVTWSDTVPLLSTPTSASHVVTTLTLGNNALTLNSNADVAGGTAALTATMATGSSDLTATVIATQLKVFGHPFDGGGTITDHDGTVTGAATISWDGSTTDNSHGFGLTSAHLTWDKDGLTADAAATINGHISVALKGAYTDSDNWSLTATGGLTGDWAPAPGLTLTKAGTSVTGSISDKKSATDTAGTVTFNIALSVAGNWSAGPVTVTNLSLGLANSAAPATACGALPASDVYLTIGGNAAIKFGAKSVALDTAACVVLSGAPAGDWRLTSAATLSGMTLVSDLTLTGAKLTVAHTGTDYSAVLVGLLTSHGVTGSGTLALISGGAGTDFLAALNIDLSELGLPLPGTGHLIYSTAAIADLGTVPGLDLGVTSVAPAVSAAAAGATAPPSPLAGISLKSGFAALASFSLPASLAGFLQQNLHLPAQPDLVVKAELSGVPTITATLTVANGGITLLDKPDGTRLGLTSISLSLSLGGGFGLAASAALTLPNPQQQSTTTPSAPPAPLTLTAAVSIQLAGVPSITLSLSKTDGPWTDAFGITGLTLGDLAIQGGITFSAPPTPSIGFGATVLSLPPTWCTAMGIQGCTNNAMEPVTFVVNISAANPIFALTLGTPDGNAFLKPLQPISPSLADDFTIDDASLIIAPFGGSVGPFTYTPGFHLRFDSRILGVNLAVQADVDLALPKMAALVDVGSFTVGGLSLQETTLHFTLDATGLSLKFAGGVQVGATTANAEVDVAANVGGVPVPGSTTATTLKFDVMAGVNNVPLAPQLTLDHLELFVHGQLPQLTDPVPQVTLGVAATATVLGASLTLIGDATVSVIGITGFDLAAAPSALHLGPVSVGGTGCDPSALPFDPSGLPPLPTNGPCVQIGFHPISATPLTVIVDGSIGVAGLSAKIHGSLGDTGLDLHGSLALNAAATVAVGGHLYFGTGLSGVKDRDASGQLVAVSAGDFRLDAAAGSTVSLLGFSANLAVAAGNIGGSQFVTATGTLNALTNGYFHSATPITLAGSFSHDNTGYRWSLHGAGSFSVGGTKADGSDGYQLANATVDASSAGSVSVSAILSAGTTLYADVSGNLDMSVGTLRFGLSGVASLHVAGVSAIGSASIGNAVSSGNPQGYLQVAATADVAVSSFVTVNGSASFDPHGNFCIGGSAHAAGFNGTVSICSPGSPNPGIHAHFAANGFTISADLNSLTSWTVYTWLGPYTPTVGGSGPISASASANFTLFFAVSSTATSIQFGTIFGVPVSRQVGQGLTFQGDGTITLQGCLAACDSVSVAASLGLNPFSVGASTSILGYDVKASWSSTNGLEVTSS